MTTSSSDERRSRTPGISADERSSLITAFLTSAESYWLIEQRNRGQLAATTEKILEFLEGLPGEANLCFDPPTVTLFFNRFVPENFDGTDPPAQLVVDVLRSWVRFAGRKGKQTEGHIDATVSAIDRFLVPG